MNVGTTTILSRAATTSRVLCPAQASKQLQSQNGISRRHQSRALCSATPNQSRRPSIVVVASRCTRFPQRRVSTSGTSPKIVTVTNVCLDFSSKLEFTSHERPVQCPWGWQNRFCRRHQEGILWPGQEVPSRYEQRSHSEGPIRRSAVFI